MTIAYCSYCYLFRYLVMFCWCTFFFFHKFSDRKIVHGVLVTKSVAKHRDGNESPLIISGWIFFIIVPEENMFQ
jgi:hypothetical protein